MTYCDGNCLSRVESSVWVSVSDDGHELPHVCLTYIHGFYNSSSMILQWLALRVHGIPWTPMLHAVPGAKLQSTNPRLADCRG